MTYTGDMQVQRVSAGSTSYQYGVLGLNQAADSAGATAYTRDNQGLLVSQRAPGGTSYYLYDGLGNVVALTDSSGAVVNTYSYSPYGETVSSTGTVANPYRFGGSYGAYTDSSTGLVKLGQRFYDPSLARWTQQDPLLHLADPTQWNRYAYVSGNPVNLVDPSGTTSHLCMGTALVTVVGLGLVVGSLLLASAPVTTLAYGLATPVWGAGMTATIAGGAGMIGTCILGLGS